MKAKPMTNHGTGAIEGHAIECPACGHRHLFNSRDSVLAKRGGPSWSFNGDLERPTFDPSMLVFQEIRG